MDEQRNRGGAAVPVFLGGRRGAAIGWSIPALRPLLTELGGASFSKGTSKGFSKGGPLIRFRTARGALLHGYLIRRHAGRGPMVSNLLMGLNLARPAVLDGYLIGSRAAA